MATKLKEPQIVQTLDTRLCADSTEWCPAVDKQNILLCGTYQLQETEPVGTTGQVRIGKLQRYSLSGLQNQQPQLTLEEEKAMNGILDIKWRCGEHADQQEFALVDAVGRLQLWRIADDNSLQNICSSELGESCLGLSLDWSCHGSSSINIVASDSTGSLTLFKTGSDLVTLDRWKAHDYEAWICAFNYWDGNVVYSGSDDCTLKGWDVRADPQSPIFTNKRAEMGVCSIQSNSLKQHILAVGSYDEHVYIYDTRAMRAPLSSVSLGGGVWRVKWDPFCGNLLLTATMYNGFHIVDCADTGGDLLPVLSHYVNDVKLGYGADWCRLKLNTATSADSRDISTPNTGLTDSWSNGSGCVDVNKQDGDPNTERPLIVTECDGVDSGTGQTPDENKGDSCFIIATCSFYDHSLQLWTYAD